MVYQVLARKWRPQVFEDVVGQEHITRTLINAMKAGRVAHAYLFSGARGVGKTSIARILAKALNCVEGETGIPCNRCHSCMEITNGSSVDVQEIDGASNRGIDEIRELRQNIKYMPSSCKYRVYIIDEVHMLTLPAFNALLKTLEEPPPHVKFLFATTEPHKVPVTILSRCQRFDLKRIPLGLLVEHLEKITGEEKIEISRSGLALLAREAEGSMRDAESLLDQVISFTGSRIVDKDITDILGIIDRSMIFETSMAIIQGSPAKCLEIVNKAFEYGYDIKEFYRALMDQFRNLLVSLIAPEEDLFDMIDTDREALRHQASMAGKERLLQSLHLLIHREENLRFSSHPRLVLEAIMIKLCQMGEILSFEELLQKIASLEKRVASLPSTEGKVTHGLLSDPEKAWKTHGRDEAPVKTSPVVPEKEGWDRLINTLGSGNGVMGNVLKEWSFVRATSDTLEIARGRSPFSATYLDEPERMEKFKGHCRQFFGKDLVIKIVDSPSEENGKRGVPMEAKPEKTARNYADLPKPVSDILDIFQGEIKGDAPLKSRGDKKG